MIQERNYALRYPKAEGERTVYDTAQRDITTAGPGDEGHSASASVRLVAPHASAGAAPSRPRAAGYVVS